MAVCQAFYLDGGVEEVKGDIKYLRVALNVFMASSNGLRTSH